MFHYIKKKKYYYFWSDIHQGKYGPFDWIFCKNKYLWRIQEEADLEKKYPWYDFCYWATNNRIFIVNKQGIENILITK